MKPISLIILLATILFIGCSKEKIDFQPEYLKPEGTGELSNVRIVNSVEYAQVTANGIPISNFLERRRTTPIVPFVVPGGTYWSEGYPGTTYFPINGYLGREWKIPNNLFKEDKRLDLFFTDGIGFGSLRKMGITITDPKHSVDYYLGTYDGSGTDTYFKVERADAGPKNPENFKIRVINLSSTVKPTSNPSGAFKDLKGPVTLLYADGQPVHAKTSQVDLSNRVSEYVEVPFGKYQFKMISGTNLPIPGTDGNIFDITIDPPTASIDIGKMKGTHILHAPIHSYKPGAAYTILVYPFKFIIYTSLTPVPLYAMHFQNGFRIIEDYAPEREVTFQRTQAFNAFVSPITIKVNGKDIGSVLDFGESTPYQVLESGKSKIQIYDAQSKLLIEKDAELQANQNYTLWTYPNSQNQIQLAIVANDLSGEKELGRVEDGTIGRDVNTFPFFRRYLNFCPDVPYLTVTADNGKFLGSSRTQNLQPGLFPEIYPNVWGSILQLPYQLMAYRSKPNQLPGVWMDEIAPLKSTDFIANKDFYKQVNWPLPVQEPGYYTVALIGRLGKDVPAKQKARMVILKHNN